jgi:hypothetical protein
MRMQWLQNLSVGGPKSARHEHNARVMRRPRRTRGGWIPLTEPRAGLAAWKPHRAPASVHGLCAPYAHEPTLPSPRQPMDLTSSSRPPRGRPCWWTARAGRRKAMRRDDDASAGVAVAGIVLASRPLALPRSLMSGDGTASDGTRHEAQRSRSAVATVCEGEPGQNPLRARTVDLPRDGRGPAGRPREAGPREGPGGRTHAPTFSL